MEVAIRIPPLGLAGDLGLPARASGIVIFAHGSGSSRHSPRNHYVAGVLQQGGLATLLLDLLTEDEEQIDLRTRHLRFDIGLLASRLIDATEWVRIDPRTAGLSAGYFGASTGGGAAIVAAAERPGWIGAVVSRGGRPDLAGPALGRLASPTLLIVGGEDRDVVELNQDAMDQMRCEARLAIIPGATHLFEERGALEEVAQLALDWLKRHLSSPHSAAPAA